MGSDLGAKRDAAYFGPFFALIATAMAAPIAAQSKTIRQLFNDGLTASNNGDYPAAAKAYAQACMGLHGGEKAAAASACLNLGALYVKGQGVEQNYSYAGSLFQKACDNFEPDGCFNIAVLHISGSGVPQSNERAMKFYEKACEGGFAEGCDAVRYYAVNLGGAGAYYRGVTAQQQGDPVTAFREFGSACNLGWWDTCNDVGVAFWSGENGVAQDRVLAMTFFQKACAGGGPNGCTNLGRGYQFGELPDIAQAKAAYEKACSIEENEECNLLGLLYFNGTINDGPSGEPNLTRAIKYWTDGCNRNFGASCTSLGLLYATGNGVPKDDSQMTTMFGMGCRGGDMLGCFKEGEIYLAGGGFNYTGWDLKRRKAYAAEQFGEACDGGYAKACISLGDQYIKGDGVKRNKPLAYDYWRKALEIEPDNTAARD